MAPDRSPPRTPYAALALFVLVACSGGGGSAGPPAPVCGNGVVEAGEACDDGNTNTETACAYGHATCTACDAACGAVLSLAGPSCGDGTTQASAGEGCDDGNAVAGDGCEPDCTVTRGTTFCRALPAAASGTCDVAPGTAGTLLRGTVLAPGAVYVGGEVAIDAAGTITCVGCACAAQAAGATVVTCAKGVVSPAFVNAHDHLSYTAAGPVGDTTGERYEQRNDWRVGLRGHTKITASGSATVAQVEWGELRFVLGGATATVGSGGAPGLLRNLDRAANLEGLAATPVHDETFPLGDQSGTQLVSSCAYPSIDTAASIAADAAYLAHVGEGVDDVARNELVCTTSFANGGQDLAQPQSAFAQAIAGRAADYADLAASGTALVWSPRSNVRLYGDTVAVAEADRLGVQIALGTDWLPTGSMNVLRELRCADAWNAERLDHHFSDEQLWAMATRNAAEVTGTGALLGSLAPGRTADVTIFDASVHHLHRAAIAADPHDVVLVLRGGKALYGDAALVTALAGTGCDALDVCGRAKQACLQSEIGTTLSALRAAVGSDYPAFFCGTPVNEPTCTPSRPASVNGSTVYAGAVTAADADGDGVPDGIDDCPSVFNPIRPVDGGVQADADGDGLGDACDPCPLAANTSVCPAPDPRDLDGDGVENVFDNCPAIPNPGQEDADQDGKGDACDACPADPNPGTAACPATIYAVKNGSLPVGATVAIANALVTGWAPSGFFLQVKPGDPGYAGADHSGVWVSAPSSTVAPGDRVSLSTASVTDFFGERGLGSATLVLLSSGEAPPAPVAVSAAEIATGGARAAALEGVLVQVSGVAVLDTAPVPGAGDAAPTYEFAVDAGLRVDDLLYQASPFPALGTTYATATGVLAYRAGNSKLEPRSAADLVATFAPLAAFGPATGTFARVGQVGGATIPQALAVAISSPVAFDTFVEVTSTDPAVRVVGGGVTIPAGQVSAPVLLDALARAAAVDLTATLNGASLTATVRVLDDTDVPSLVAFDPPGATIGAGGTQTLTVSLDLPPAVDTPVALSLAPADAGSIPTTATVPRDQLSTTVTFTAGSAAAQATLEATLGGVTLRSNVTVLARSGSPLVINEVDYDQPGTDTSEFVEIRNVSAAPVSLAGVFVYLVNGATSPSAVYRTVDLGSAGTLAPGGYLVVADPSLVVTSPGALRVDFTVAADAIQNGPADGIALVDTSSGVPVLLDALSYEGLIMQAQLPGVGTVSLVEGRPIQVADPTTAVGSLVRMPDGSDTDDAAVDWMLSTRPTPGAANQL